MANGITQLLHQTNRAKRLFPDEPLRWQSPTRGCNGTILGRETHNRSTTAANYHSSVIFVMGRMAPRRIAAKPSCQICCDTPAS